MGLCGCKLATNEQDLDAVPVTTSSARMGALLTEMQIVSTDVTVTFLCDPQAPPYSVDGVDYNSSQDVDVVGGYRGRFTGINQISAIGNNSFLVSDSFSPCVPVIIFSSTNETKGSGSFNPKVLAVWVACHDETGTEPGRRKLNARKPRRRKLNALLPSVRASRPSRTGRKVSGTNGTYLSARSCFFVIPAKAGIQCLRPFASRRRHWIPAFAGMTSLSKCHSCQGQFVTTVWGLIRLGV
jgi:hypothetical protein